MELILLIVLILVLAGLPQAGWHDYGYGPSGALGLVLMILVILILLGRLPLR